MDCDICSREHHPHRRPFLCTMDARNKCYEGRLANIRALMENENLQQEVDLLLADAEQRVVLGLSSGESSKSLVLETSVSEQRAVEERTSQIIRQAEDLKGEINKARREIETRKAALGRRRGDLVSASDGIEHRRARRLSDVETTMGRARASWAVVTSEMASHRSFLCLEAAKLYGLTRVPVRGPLRYEYRIGKVEAISLTNLNALDPEIVSASLGHMAHMLVLASRYLAIRLPMMIRLPHRDNPIPNIYGMQASYRMHDAPPLMGVLDGSEADGDDSPRPRPLTLTEPIGTLAKGDTVRFGGFVDALAFLAFDVAWACASQGIRVVRSEATTFEDMCHVGRNLWMLLHGDHKQDTTKASTLHNLETSTTAPNEKPKTKFSHGTAHAFLSTAVNIDLLKAFGLMAPAPLTDELLQRLRSECMTDWEVVDDDVWSPDTALEPAVVVGARKPKEQCVGAGAAAAVTPASEEVRAGGNNQTNSNTMPVSNSHPQQGENSACVLPALGPTQRNRDDNGPSGSNSGIAGAYDLVAGARARWTMLRGNRG